MVTANYTLSPRCQLIEQLMASIPFNGLNLPQGYYRADLLPNDTNAFLLPPPSGVQPRADNGGGSRSSGELQPWKQSQELVDRFEHAYTMLSFREGYPTLPDGRPFWSQLEFESPEAFIAFEEYMSQGNKGARQIFLLARSGNGPRGHRTLQEWSILNYWTYRARAYDLFRVAAHRKAREQAAFALEHDHYSASTRLMNKVLLYFDELPFDIEHLPPKAAIDLLKTLINWQRLSVGLPTSQSQSYRAEETTPPHASVELILRSLVKQQQAKGGSVGSSDLTDPYTVLDPSNPNSPASRARRAFDELLSDPETATLAQEMILRVNTPPDRE